MSAAARIRYNTDSDRDGGKNPSPVVLLLCFFTAASANRFTRSVSRFRVFRVDFLALRTGFLFAIALSFADAGPALVAVPPAV
ncbi:MAG: hypothetical protein ACRD1P_11880, partial [Thermoanaerobaculia bacterium]